MCEGEFLLKYVEVSGEAEALSRSISFVGDEISPLSYAELANIKLNQPVTVRLSLRNSSIFETNIDGLNPTSHFSVAAMLESTHSSRIVSLERGGWLPSGLSVARSGTTVLLDRNVVSEIKGRFKNGKKTRQQRDFIDLLSRFEGRINPLLYAMEGNLRSVPSPDVVHAQFNEAVECLRSALPKAQISADDGNLQGVLGLIEDSRSSLAHRQQCLLDLAPNLASPISKAKRQSAWSEVLEIADRNQIPRCSILVLAALSVVAVPNSGSPAARVFKFRPNYSGEDAYNALADIRALEILVAIFAHFPRERVSLFTADKNLALLWSGIRASNFACAEGKVVFDTSPVIDLFPGAALEWWHADAQKM